MKTTILAFLFQLLIVDKDTQEPLVGVSIQNLKTGKITYSDFDGFIFLNDTSCDYTVSYITYQDTIINGGITKLELEVE